MAEELSYGTQLVGMGEEEVDALAQQVGPSAPQGSSLGRCPVLAACLMDPHATPWLHSCCLDSDRPRPPPLCSLPPAPQVDAIAQPEYMACRLTSRGMLRALRLLLAAGLVQLHTDARGRLAVVLLGPVDGAAPGPSLEGGEPVRLTVLPADVDAGGGRPLLDATLPDRAAVAAQLQGLGLAAVVDRPSGQQLQAAVPAALWGGPQVRRSCWPRAAGAWRSCHHPSRPRALRPWRSQSRACASPRSSTSPPRPPRARPSSPGAPA